jgi:hypothetical protein
VQRAVHVLVEIYDRTGRSNAAAKWKAKLAA